MTKEETTIAALTALEAALEYASWGWPVLPLAPNSKIPATAHGVTDATTDHAIIRGWWKQNPRCNVGIAAGIRSGLVVYDVDPRNGGDASWGKWLAEHGALPDTAMQLTAGGGEHHLMRYQPGLRSCKLVQGVDFLSDGRYFVAYPSTIDGRRYEWEGSSDPFDGVAPAPIPARWLAAMQTAKPVAALCNSDAGSIIKGNRNNALTSIAGYIRNAGLGYFEMLAALRSANDTRCDPPMPDSEVRQIARSVTRYEPESDVAADTALGESAADALTGKNSLKIKSAISAVMPDFTPGMLAPPGILGEITRWINATSGKPQPHFAVQVAIAAVATLCGRRYVTDRGNWPSMYLLNVGPSACGKEYGKAALEAILHACGAAHLIGPGGYTSHVGVLTALHDKPSHVATLDEFHRTLEQAAMPNNEHKRGMLTAMMEAWGRCNGAMHPPGYGGLTEGKGAKEAAGKITHNPALSVLAMATPHFYESVGGKALQDGFCNRFLMIETPIGRQVNQFTRHQPVPEFVIEWAAGVRQPASAMVQIPGVMPSNHDDAFADPLKPVAPFVVPFSDDAMKMVHDFEAKNIARMDEYESKGVAEMFGRSTEMAMRLALICALGCSAVEIDTAHIGWAIEYIDVASVRAAERLSAAVSDSAFAAVRNSVLEKITKSGEHGLTTRDLHRACRRFASLDTKGQQNVLASLVNLDMIRLVHVCKKLATSGKKRMAWVAIDDSEHIG